jgi:hypothetical protein
MCDIIGKSTCAVIRKEKVNRRRVDVRTTPLSMRQHVWAYESVSNSTNPNVKIKLLLMSGLMYYV